MGSIKTKHVQIKESGIVARGVIVNSRNLVEIAYWAPGSTVGATFKNGLYTNRRVRVKTKKGIRAAHLGDIVIKLSLDNFIVIKAEDFTEKIVIE